ncbi:porin OmpA [Otariodibacter oris]|uniref:Outer membrane protein A n=1 Tax=Otariodibacter oris TaxID=1032623 RepID=A0A420XGC6_9PAST|nr:porin OmpA [Otariodibacter oris]QGM80048.1 hypothetical protein A6A10_00800 [Otariodibacter oris]RKR71872.1 OOP family OmpA-OmpF porin [Otariodibacter oris]
MKKSLIALAVSGLAVASVQAAPQANTFYVGAKTGWASFHDGLTQFDAKDNGHGNGFGINRNSVTYGVFGGYQITDNFAVELGYDYFGRVRGHKNFSGKKDKLAAKHSAHGTHISLKASYPVLADLDVYGRVGAALVRSDYFEQEKARTPRKQAHNLKTSLMLAGGVEYAITPSLAARVEYQWLSRVGNMDKGIRKEGRESNTQYSPDIHSVSAGLSYRFAQGPAPVVEPEVITKNFAFSSDVLFDFGKASLKPESAAALDEANGEINKLGLASPAIQVSGYTDRIGSDASNLKLSQRRAESVANYMVSKGVNPANVTAVGYGEANPVTGNTCDAVQGRKALIACLAPDRRVELQVQGSKEIVM